MNHRIFYIVKLFFLSSIIFVSVAFSQSQKPVISCSQSKSIQRLLEFQSTITEDQEKIDISFYRIDLDIDFDQLEISGSVIIKGGVGLSQPDSIVIDFSSDMSVDSVKLYGESISYDHDDDLLRRTQWILS